MTIVNMSGQGNITSKALIEYDEDLTAKQDGIISDAIDMFIHIELDTLISQEDYLDLMYNLLEKVPENKTAISQLIAILIKFSDIYHDED